MDIGTEKITILAAFVGGLLSFLSPCVFPLLPTFSAVLAGTAEEDSHWRIYINAAGFLTGFTFVFILMGATASLAGQWFFDHQPEIQKIGAVLIIIMGLSMSGILQWNLIDREYRPFLLKNFHGPVGAFFLGVSFTVGWTPCTGPILTTILVYASQSATVANGVLLLLVYAIGFSLPFFIMAVVLRRYLNHIRRLYRWLPYIQRFAGWVLIVIGIFMWMDWMQKGLGYFWSIF